MIDQGSLALLSNVIYQAFIDAGYPDDKLAKRGRSDATVPSRNDKESALAFIYSNLPDDKRNREFYCDMFGMTSKDLQLMFEKYCETRKGHGR